MRAIAARHLIATMVLVVLMVLMTQTATASSQAITDLYSNMESADVSLQGDTSELRLQMDLMHDDVRIATKSFDVNGSGTWVLRWPAVYAEKGSYEAIAGLYRNESLIDQRRYEFYYGGVEPIRFDVRDFRADSRGMHLAISASDPTVVDIYYMLIEGRRAVYVTREQVVPIAGSFAMPITRDYSWRQILRDGQRYEGRVKIVELNHNQTRAFMNSFLAEEDAAITETYQDETGASATVLGNSRVPFAGLLRFTLSQNGLILNVTEKKTPILLSGDDETVEITWNGTLEPGIYQLRTALYDSDGVVRDMQENVIEAEVRPLRNSTGAAEEAAFPASAAPVALIALFLFLRRR